MGLALHFLRGVSLGLMAPSKEVFRFYLPARKFFPPLLSDCFLADAPVPYHHHLNRWPSAHLRAC